MTRTHTLLALGLVGCWLAVILILIVAAVFDGQDGRFIELLKVFAAVTGTPVGMIFGFYFGREGFGMTHKGMSAGEPRN